MVGFESPGIELPWRRSALSKCSCFYCICLVVCECGCDPGHCLDLPNRGPLQLSTHTHTPQKNEISVNPVAKAMVSWSRNQKMMIR